MASRLAIENIDAAYGAVRVLDHVSLEVNPGETVVLLGTLQQVATVTISSAVNVLIVGILLVAFVIIAPNGIVGLVQDRLRARSK